MPDAKRKAAHRKSLLLSLFFVVSLFVCSSCRAAGADNTFGGLVDNGAVLLDDCGHTLVAINPTTQFIPASTLKIATSILALDILGKDFRFVTTLYLANNRLYVKGAGDPFLVSEEIGRMAAMLQARGITAIDKIVLDDTYFDLEKEDFYGDSNNPYDALNGALAVNFNTINVTVTAGGKVHSAEKQTPTIDLMRDLAAGLPPGTHRISLPRSQSLTARYGGELFVAIFEKAGIQVKGGWQPGTLPKNATLVLSYQSSKSLKELLKSMLLYSNNFTANQLFLACGVRQSRPPATWEKARGVAREHFAASGFSAEELQLYEGSGLSRKNRVTAATMLRLLNRFKPFRALLPEKNGAPVKSGTLKGVYCYAGYLASADAPNPFVIMLNQPRNTRDRILDRLKKIFISSSIAQPSKKNQY